MSIVITNKLYTQTHNIMNKKVMMGLLVTSLACTLAYAMEVVKTTDAMMKDDSSMMYDNISMTSSKEEITKVQMMLVEKGYLMMPSGASYGYYGPLTTAAFAKYKHASKMTPDTMKTSDAMMNKNSSMMYDTISMSSSNEDVTKVQMMLVEKGYLVMPHGASYGYYGPLTTKAYAKYKNATMMKADMMKKEDTGAGAMAH